ncbi:MAG: hypothetical protein HND53_11005 [Proteobacteria bacterium]|nr:hypothetical protein [Pseudomonadota bacterium]NOG61021.1 hypothetical protein [Pseudomonadota bacterium]
MKSIHVGYFVAGIILLVNSLYGLLTGNIFTIDLEVLKKLDHQYWYYFNLLCSTLIGSFLLFRSFLFIPCNKEFHKKSKEYEKEMMAENKKDTEVNFIETLKMLVIGIIVFAIIFYFFIYENNL